jgi:uridine phosphorylase
MKSPWETDDLPEIDTPERSACRATRCLPGEIAPYVLLPGDPGRAARIAEEWLTDGKLVMANREFHSYTGSYKGVPVSVISTGLGSPGAAMVVQDLPRLGVKAAIRVGTAGSARAEVAPGDVVVGTGAVRDEGVSHKFVPANFPAQANLQVTNALNSAAKVSGANVHCGIVHTSDAFKHPNLADEQALYGNAGVLAFEMEASAVMILAQLNNIPVGCIFSIDGYVQNVAGGNTNPDSDARNRGIKTAITVSLEALVSLADSG